MAELAPNPGPCGPGQGLLLQTAQGTVTNWYHSVHTAIFEDHLTGNALRTARAYALMSVVHYDAMVARASRNVAAREAMRILGGNGYSKDFPVERFTPGRRCW